MDAGLRLQACQPVDVAEAFTVPLANLTPSQYAHNICLHPTKPLLAVAAGTSLAVYDLVTHTRVSRLDMRGIVTEMAFSPDGVVLVLVMQEWIIYGWSLATSRVHLLVPRRDKAEKPLDACLLTVGGAGRGFLYYCKYGKEAVRRATLSLTDAVDAKGRPVKIKEGSWGAKMRLEPSKAILGLALAGDGAQLLVLHSDGVMRGYNSGGPVADTFNPLFQVQVQEGVTKGLPPPGTLLVVPHPSSPTSMLILQAARFGGNMSLFQLPAGATMPSLLARSRIPGGGVVLGAGLLQDSQQIVVVVSSQPEGGRLRTLSWSLPDRGASAGSQGGDALGLQPVKVEPMDLGALLDPRASSQQQLLPALPAAPPPLNASTFSHAQTSRFDTTLGLGSPTSGAANNSKTGGEGAGVSALLHGLWSPVPGWAASVSHAGTLAGGLAPVVSKVLVHRLLPLVAVQLQPSAYMKNTPTYMQLTLSGASADEYAQIRKLLSVPLLTATSWDSLLSAGASTAMVSPQHSSLQNWTPTSTTLTITSAASTPALPKPGAVAPPASVQAKPISLPLSAAPHLTLPGSIYFVSDSALCKYSLASRAITTLATLPEGPTGASQRVVHQVLFSRAGAWLVFFEQRGVASAAHDRWQWTVIQAGDTTAPVWLKPGKFGAFLGPDEDQFAVVDASGRLSAVFSVSTCNQAGASPDYLYSLEGLCAGGHALPIFPGPPRDPVPDPANSAVIGCVMWQSTAGGLAARPLPQVLDAETGAKTSGGGGGGTGGGGGPNPGYSTLGLSGPGGYYKDPNDSSSDGEYDTPRAGDGPVAGEGLGEGGEPLPEPQGTGAVASGANLGPLGAKYWLPLQTGELVLQVAWQSLSWEPSGGSSAITGAPATPTTNSNTGEKKKKKKKGGPTMAAVLTNQRVMLVTELLHLHTSVSLSEHTFGSLPCPATSLLWAGPALLVSLSDGRVLQVTWSGAVHTVCSVADGSKTHLVGATPDSLLMLRAVENKRPGVGSWEVVVRPLSMLQPLVLGWSSLGLLASTSAGVSAVHACRSTMKALLEHMDPQHVTPGLVWALLGTCALDLGYALASHNESVFEPSAYMAAAAAAGEWTAVERALTLELERAAYHPAPPPRGSASHSKLMAAAAGAVTHGQMQRAVSLLQMAGEWRLALAVATSCGDMNLVHGVAAKMATSPTSPTVMEEAGAAQRMATVIRALYGSTVSSVPDAKLQLMGPDGEPCLPEPDAWLLAAPKTFINAFVESIDTEGLRADPGETIALAPRDHPLVSALALDAMLKGSINLKALQPTTTETGRVSNPGAANQQSSGLQSAGPSTKALDTLPPSDPMFAPGVNPLDDIFGLDNLVQRTATGKDEFASLGTQSQPGSDSDSDLSNAPSPAQQWKGKVTIRDKGTAAGSAGGDQLREAMKTLKIAPPGTPSALSAGGVSFNTSTTSPALLSGGPSFQGISPALAAGLTDIAAASTRPGSGPSFQGLSPALATGMAQQPAQQVQAQRETSEDIDFFFSQFNSTAPKPPPTQPVPTAAAFQGLSPALQPNAQPTANTGAFQGLSPALAAGMTQASPALAGAFQGLSPALAAGMTQPARQAPAAATSAGPFQGLSPALAAGMTQQQQPQQSAGDFQGLSPALASGMTQPGLAAQGVPAPSLQGLSPALAAGMSQRAPPPTTPTLSLQGLSPALAAGMAPVSSSITAPSLHGLSPALAAGMTQPNSSVPTPSIQGLSPALAAGMVGAPAAAAPPVPAPAAPVGNPDALYHQGVSLLEQGQWAAAELHFSAALAALTQSPPNEANAGKMSYCAQYLAAVQLLAPASAAAGVAEARLYRYASSLGLDNRHRVPLTKESIARNKSHKNYKYCGDTLTWMVTTLVGTVPDSALTPLQEAIDECERAGNRDAYVPKGEDLETFAQIVASCATREDVVRVVGPIISGK